jgi:hypothetical protein
LSNRGFRQSEPQCNFTSRDARFLPNEPDQCRAIQATQQRLIARE